MGLLVSPLSSFSVERHNILLRGRHFAIEPESVTKALIERESYPNADAAPASNSRFALDLAETKNPMRKRFFFVFFYCHHRTRIKKCEAFVISTRLARVWLFGVLIA